MNQLIIKRAVLFSLIFGACIGLVSSIPFLIGISIFVLAFFSSVFVILFMRKDEKYVAFLNNEQGAIMGGIIGFFATVGFFIAFCPMVCILHFIFKNYYSYMIPDMFQEALWLFIVVVLMVGLIFALTNSATGMGTTWIIGYFEKKPQDYDARLDIKIED